MREKIPQSASIYLQTRLHALADLDATHHRYRVLRRRRFVLDIVLGSMLAMVGTIIYVYGFSDYLYP